jgi:hypothetical protein
MKIDNDSVLVKLEQTEADAFFIREAVKRITLPRTLELDNLIESVRANLDLIKQNNMVQYDDVTLQLQMLRLPVILYILGDKLEELTADEELSSYYLNAKYNMEVVRDIGQIDKKRTIADKKAQAELVTEEERIVKQIYTMAIAEIKLKLVNAQNLFRSMKLITEMRTRRMELNNHTEKHADTAFLRSSGVYKE